MYMREIGHLNPYPSFRKDKSKIWELGRVQVWASSLESGFSFWSYTNLTQDGKEIKNFGRELGKN